MTAHDSDVLFFFKMQESGLVRVKLLCSRLLHAAGMYWWVSAEHATNLRATGEAE